ncbi:MAG: hypothetical protein GF400_04155 [Candidatus Eisenbacteria bacterium]|nr:hypothetical protein [Candidatus Eisenbacteria bacterium]
MTRLGRALFAVVVVVAPTLTVSGCTATGECVEIAETVTESETVAIGDAEEVDVRLVANIGEFVIRGGAEALAEADFTYNIAKWKPTVEYSESGRKGILTIRQPDVGVGKVPEDAENRWDIRLNSGMPLSISMEADVGDATLKLAGLIVERLVVDQGVGATMIDLGAEIARDSTVEVDGGVGDITIYVPQNAGVIVKAGMGLGSITAEGFEERGGAYVNESYGKADVTVEIKVDTGIGSMTIRTSGRGSASV